MHIHWTSKYKWRPLHSERDVPDVGADVHLAALQGGVHGEVDWVGGLSAVVLMDQHRVLRDVKPGGVPVQNRSQFYGMQ